jgi:hypothetical protein
MTTPKAGRETGMVERPPEISERVNPLEYWNHGLKAARINVVFFSTIPPFHGDSIRRSREKYGLTSLG